jgi:hypothetical protein
MSRRRVPVQALLVLDYERGMMGVFDVAPPRRHVIAKAPESTEVQLF